MSAQVVRTLRSGAFEVEVQASKADDDAGDDRDGSEDEDEDDEGEATPQEGQVRARRP